MAFTFPFVKTAIKVVADAEKDQGAEAGHQGSFPRVVRRLTLGIKQVYGEIDASRSFGAQNIMTYNPTFPTNELGHLLVGKVSPTIVKRYRLVEQVAIGTFSQIFKAIDVYLNKEVALKVIRVGYGSMGARESSMLHYLASKSLRGHHNCKTLRSTILFCIIFNCFFSNFDISMLVVRCSDSFWFEDHFCLVLDLYECTLYNMVRNPMNAMGESIKETRSDFASSLVQVNRYRNIS
jgi:serine/threonine protein kinase